jgi:hypothetical protein
VAPRRLQAVGASWIAWRSGDRAPDVVDEHNRARAELRGTLHGLGLDEQDVHHCGYGSANPFLQPSGHVLPALTRAPPRYRERCAALVTADQWRRVR